MGGGGGGGTFSPVDHAAVRRCASGDASNVRLTSGEYETLRCGAEAEATAISSPHIRCSSSRLNKNLIRYTLFGILQKLRTQCQEFSQARLRKEKVIDFLNT